MPIPGETVGQVVSLILGELEDAERKEAEARTTWESAAMVVRELRAFVEHVKGFGGVRREAPIRVQAQGVSNGEETATVTTPVLAIEEYAPELDPAVDVPLTPHASRLTPDADEHGTLRLDVLHALERNSQFNASEFVEVVKKRRPHAKVSAVLAELERAVSQGSVTRLSPGHYRSKLYVKALATAGGGETETATEERGRGGDGAITAEATATAPVSGKVGARLWQMVRDAIPESGRFTTQDIVQAVVASHPWIPEKNIGIALANLAKSPSNPGFRRVALGVYEVAVQAQGAGREAQVTAGTSVPEVRPGSIRDLVQQAIVSLAGKHSFLKAQEIVRAVQMGRSDVRSKAVNNEIAKMALAGILVRHGKGEYVVAGGEERSTAGDGARMATAPTGSGPLPPVRDRVDAVILEIGKGGNFQFTTRDMYAKMKDMFPGSEASELGQELYRMSQGESPVIRRVAEGTYRMVGVGKN